MAVLKNAKQEKLAQELAKGKSATEAMEAAGYSDPRNSTRLTKNNEIRARVIELQERSAAKVEITVEILTKMLKDDRDLARELGQASAAVSAVDKLGRLHGLVIDKKEIGKPGDFERMSEDELEAFIASREDRSGEGSGRAGKASGSAGMRGKSSGLH